MYNGKRKIWWKLIATIVLRPSNNVDNISRRMTAILKWNTNHDTKKWIIIIVSCSMAIMLNRKNKFYQKSVLRFELLRRSINKKNFPDFLLMTYFENCCEEYLLHWQWSHQQHTQRRICEKKKINNEKVCYLSRIIAFISIKVTKCRVCSLVKGFRLMNKWSLVHTTILKLCLKLIPFIEEIKNIEKIQRVPL